MLERIVHSLISPSLLPEISWTGKGKGKEKKMALCRLNCLLDFMKATAFKADNHFTDAKFKDKIVYGILKRAPSKYGKSEHMEQTSQLSTDMPNNNALNASQSAPASVPVPSPAQNFPPNNQQQLQQLSNNCLPNSQQPIYPPYHSNQFGQSYPPYHYQQQQPPYHNQQQPPYHIQHINYNHPNEMSLQGGSSNAPTENVLTFHQL